MSAVPSWGRLEIWPQLGLAAVTVALAGAGAGAVLNLAFLPLATAVALFLYLRSPTRDYISFCLWIWMLAPLVRRLADWSSGFQEFSLIIIAPLAVSILCVLRADRRLFWSYTPFVLFIVVYCYGAFIGFTRGQFFSAAYAFVMLIVPVLFGCYLLTFPRETAAMAQVMLRTLVYGSLAISAYAVDQYFNLRPWDQYWLTASDMGSIGVAMPQMFRLFGTLNSPGPFAIFLMAGLLAMLSPTSSRLRLIAAPLALLALALTLVRSSWGGLVIGLLFLFVAGRGVQRFKYMLVGMLTVLLALPLLTLEPVSEALLARLDTVTNLSGDISYNARVGFSTDLLEQSDVLILGNGLGLTGLGTKFDAGNSDAIRDFDNGVLDLFYNFGFMALVLVGALLAMVYRAVRVGFMGGSARIEAAIVLAVLSQMVFSNVLNGFGGMCVFPFVAVIVGRRGTESSRRMPVMPAARFFVR